jgi:3-hydroxyanthranilate 3,4-dioxygenase
MCIANTPHNPVRFADTIGIVIERTRPEKSLGKNHFLLKRYSLTSNPDRLRWYCRSGAHDEPTIIREEVFHVTDLGTQLKPLINNWIANADLRKCPHCGEVAAPK